MTSIDDPIKDLTKRQLEDLAERIQRELQTCIACGNIGAEPHLVRPPRKGTPASLLICPPCFEKHRLPPSRAQAAA